MGPSAAVPPKRDVSRSDVRHCRPKGKLTQGPLLGLMRHNVGADCADEWVEIE